MSEPRDGKFLHYAGEKPCGSCKWAVVAWSSARAQWRVDYFKEDDPHPIDGTYHNIERMQELWDQGQYIPIYSPIVALPDGV